MIVNFHNEGPSHCKDFHYDYPKKIFVKIVAIYKFVENIVAVVKKVAK